MRKLLFIALTSMVLLALTLSGLAAESDFTASVTAKSAPGVVAVKLGEYAGAIAVIRNESGGASGIYEKSITITSVSDAEKAPSDTIKNGLTDAYEEIRAAESLGALAPELQSVITQTDSRLSVDDIVVRDLFDVTLEGTYSDYLDTIGNFLEITFDLGIGKDDFIWVMTRCPGDDWAVLDNVCVINNGDGTVTVRFYKLCPVAFMVEADKSVVDPDNPEVVSPQTGYNDYMAFYLTAAAAFGIVYIRHEIRKRKS